MRSARSQNNEDKQIRGFLSVIVPAFNEGSRIRPTLQRLGRYLAETFTAFEIIVVDDGSSDDTASVVRDVGRQLREVSLLHNPTNAGKGHAVKAGVLHSKGDLVLVCDADLSTPIEEIEKLLPLISSGFDIVIGSRGLPESDIVIRQPRDRERMGKIFNVFVRALLLGGIKDTQCGFKLFKGETAKRLFQKSLIKGFSFDVEVLFLARKLGYTITEVPVRWFNSPDSRVRLLRDPARMFIDLFRISLNRLFGKYGA